MTSDRNDLEALACEIGAKGSPANEQDRLAFEAWMRGHCWALCATWRGNQYKGDAEEAGRICPDAMRTRMLWAAWRDRGELARRLQTARAPEEQYIRFDYLDGEGREQCKMITHEDMRQRYAELFAQKNILFAAAPAAERGMAETEALPMETAPRGGTMVRLLVEFDEHDVEDSPGPSWTIGAVTNDEPDAEFKFAGWCWTHDHFTEGKGKPVGWLPMLSDNPAPESREAPKCADCDAPNGEHCRRRIGNDGEGGVFYMCSRFYDTPESGSRGEGGDA